ncbi:hypothetical protein V494_07130 [Pseudogymnoascus sp. VKM F-4513 (FW-928)]|nr:hypothetical protein V494_07130 [Pseudogymnoascus sp. VKM F-4513 (FW-928)]
MSSAHPDDGGGGAPAPHQIIFNPPATFADFKFQSRHGFQYTEASFQRQLVARDNNKSERYQQKEAFPRPDGVSHDLWKKCFNSADSWVYGQCEKKATESLDIRQNSHRTRERAELNLIGRLRAAGQTAPGPDPPQAPTPPGGDSSGGNNSSSKGGPNNKPKLPPSSSASPSRKQQKKTPAQQKQQQQPSESSTRKRKPRQTSTQQQPPSESSTRKRTARQTSTQEQPPPPHSSTRGNTSRANNPPPAFQAPRGSVFYTGSYSAPRPSDPASSSDYPPSIYENIDPRLLHQEPVVHITPSFRPGERNQAYRSDPTSFGPVYPNLYNGHRYGEDGRSRPARAVASNSLYTGPAIASSNSVNASGQASSTGNSSNAPPPAQSFSTGNSVDLPIRLSPTHTRNSSSGVQQQQQPPPPPPSFSSGGDNSSSEFQAPRGSVFFTGNYSAFPDNSNYTPNQSSSSKVNSKIGAQQTSSKDNSKIGVQQTSSSEHSNVSQQPSSFLGGNNSTGGFQAPRGSVFFTGNYSAFPDNSNYTPNQSSSKGNSKIGAQKPAPSSSKNNSKTAQDQSSPKNNSKIGAQPPSTKAKAEPPRAKMSSQPKKSKGRVEYCVCKRLKHDTKMIACEGGCENWFHVTCVELLCLETDGVSKFICGDCGGATTYKRVCRLEGCNRPHSSYESVDSDGNLSVGASKYCGRPHRDEFFKRVYARIDPQFASELRSYFAQTSLGDFQTAGDQPSGPGLPDGIVATGPPHNDEGMTVLDINLRAKCHKSIEKVLARIASYKNRERLVTLLGKYSEETLKKYVEENKIVQPAPKRAKVGKSGKGAAGHTICGYDPRIVSTHDWITRFMATPEGKEAWESGVIGEYTPNPDFYVDIEPEYYKGICVATKCQRHNNWYQLRVDECEAEFEWRGDDLARENKALDELYERVQTRLALKRNREILVKEKAALMTEENAREFLRLYNTTMGDKDLIVRKLLRRFLPEN